MNLADPGTLKAFLERHGLIARKGLGQHFLCSSSAVDAIVSAVTRCKGVLEIGPGPGVLTGPLSDAHDVLALEVDERMIEALRDSAPGARVLKQDALEADLTQLLQSLGTPRAVVSNLPYYITGPLITRIAEAKGYWQVAVLMMQKEVATRILAPVGNRDRGSLSVFLQAQFEISRIANVPAGAFMPPPKVDSIVLSLVPTANEDSDEFFAFVRSAFAHPRKTLVNNLIGPGLPRERILEWLGAADLPERSRPSDLDVSQWRTLYMLRAANAMA